MNKTLGKIFPFYLLLFSSFCLAQPKMKLRSETLDFGTVYFGHEARDTFYIVNEGNKKLIIEEVYCNDGGAVVFMGGHKDIAPNDSAFIIIGFKNDGRTGEKDQVVTIHSNEKYQTIHLKAFLKSGPLIKFESDSINVDVFDQNLYSATFRFRNVGDESLYIIKTEGSGKAVAKYFPKHPVLPDHTDSIVVIITPQHPQASRFERYLNVLGNFNNGREGDDRKVLRIIGHYKGKE